MGACELTVTKLHYCSFPVSPKNIHGSVKLAELSIFQTSKILRKKGDCLQRTTVDQRFSN